MDISVKKAFEGGRINAIASKSCAHRIMICAALSNEKTNIVLKTTSEDIEATKNCLAALGADIRNTLSGIEISPITKANEGALLKCNESGSTYRFMLPVACAVIKNASFELKGRLPYRPMHQLFDELTKNGIEIDDTNKSLVKTKGILKNASYTLPGDTSSQFITGMMLALPKITKNGSIKVVNGMQSKGYIEITAHVMRLFGIDVLVHDDLITVKSENGYVSPKEITVEGDWSNAAFPFSAGAIAKKEVIIDNIDYSSPQGDKKIVDVLKKFGCSVDIHKNSVKLTPGSLKAIDIDCSDIPDMVPAIAAVAALAEGETHITNIARLKIKESDRIKTVSEALINVGAHVTVTDDSMTVFGKKSLLGGIVSAQGDHRIAMMAACIAQACEKDVIIKGAEAVRKSYPAFFEDMKSLGMISEKKED